MANLESGAESMPVPTPLPRPARRDHPFFTAKTVALSPRATIELVRRAKSGDEDARDQLYTRCSRKLASWAHGRLPPRGRGIDDTIDLVQEVVIKFLNNLAKFDPEHEGAVQGYLHKALLGAIIDRLRKPESRTERQSLVDVLLDPAKSPLEIAIGAERQARFEQARDRLSEADRLLIVLRIELQYSFEEVAVALGKPSVDAARMAVNRAIKRLVQEISNAPR